MNRPTRFSQAGELEDRDATPFKYSFQAITVTDGQRVIGHLMRRGKAGVEAYDINDKSLGLFPDQKGAADAVSRAAAS